MRAIVLYVAISLLAALAAYIIRANNKLVSNALLLVSIISMCIILLSIIVEQ